VAKSKVGFYADDVDMSRARGAFLATMGQPGHSRTWSEFIAAALMRHVVQLEADLNGGEPFPAASVDDTPRGRPLREA